MRAGNHDYRGGRQRQKQFNCCVESLAFRAQEGGRRQNDETGEVSRERAFRHLFGGKLEQEIAESSESLFRESSSFGVFRVK
jgi:hypothetical protein